MVVSDNAGALALSRARSAGLETAVVRWDEFARREDFSDAVAEAIDDSGAKGVVLAGFMRVLSPGFIDRFPDRILNIHPSLLPAFPGAHAVESALDHGAKITGVTVHFVDEYVDHGPVIAQKAVPILDDDTPERLHARIQVEEHDLYPEVVRAFIDGRLHIDGRKVRWA